MDGIDTETWHDLAENITAWRQAVKKGVRAVEAERVKAKAEEALDIKVQQNPVSADIKVQQNLVNADCGADFVGLHVYQTRARACKSRIGLFDLNECKI